MSKVDVKNAADRLKEPREELSSSVPPRTSAAEAHLLSGVIKEMTTDNN